MKRARLARKTQLLPGGGNLKRTEMKRGRGPRARRKSYTQEERELHERWKAAVPRGMHGHHAIRQQVLARLAHDAGLPVAVIVWDTAWMMVVDPEEHERHTNRSRRLLLSQVPESAWRAATFLDAALEHAGKPATAVISLEREYESG